MPLPQVSAYVLGEITSRRIAPVPQSRQDSNHVGEFAVEGRQPHFRGQRQDGSQPVDGSLYLVTPEVGNRRRHLHLSPGGVVNIFTARIGRVSLISGIQHLGWLIGTQVKCHRVTGAPYTATGKQAGKVIICRHVFLCFRSPLDRLARGGQIGRVGFLARQKDAGAVERAALKSAPGQLTGPGPLPVPERHLRQRRQRKRNRTRMTRFLSKDQRGTAVSRSNVLLAQVTACAGKKSTGLGPNDIQVTRLPQTLMLLQ